MDDRSDPIEAMCAAHGPVDSAGRFLPGTIFGDWRLTAFIGRGGSGEVYCAEHAALGTPVAVKVLVRDEERARARFEREAKLLAELKSESFPRFYGYGKANGVPYIAMELLEPGDMPSGDKAVARFMLKVCDAVAELHSHGLVHRDIKPGNILWRNGVPVLSDLGLVKRVTTSDVGQRTSSITLGGVGTPGYGAPEQMERGEVSFASDIHALGVLADHCFGGNPPRAWTRIIERATSSIPARRYPSVASFARVIRWHYLFLKMSKVAACVGMLAVAFVALRRLLVPFGPSPYATRPPVGETPDLEQRRVEGAPPLATYDISSEQAAPVLFASAILNGAEAKDVRWFLDDDHIKMPYRLIETNGRGKLSSYKWLRAVVWRDGKVYSAKEEGGIPSEAIYAYVARRPCCRHVCEDIVAWRGAI